MLSVEMQSGQFTFSQSPTSTDMRQFHPPATANNECYAKCLSIHLTTVFVSHKYHLRWLTGTKPVMHSQMVLFGIAMAHLRLAIRGVKDVDSHITTRRPLICYVICYANYRTGIKTITVRVEKNNNTGAIHPAPICIILLYYYVLTVSPIRNPYCRIFWDH